MGAKARQPPTTMLGSTLPKQARVIDSQGGISGLRQACASWAALR